MRLLSPSLLVLVPHAVDAFKLPFSLDFLRYVAPDAVSHTVVPHRIAVIGAGAGGSAAAFWAAKAHERSGVVVEVDVYERSGYVGGRSTTVYPYNDTTLDPVELGASIFVPANRNLWRAAHEFNLEKITFGDDDDDGGGVGFWDGEEFVFTMSGAKGVFGWWDSIKAVWRYGWKSPKKTQEIVDAMIQKFLTLYSPESPTWTNITSLVSDLQWTELVAQTTAEYLDANGILPRFSREVVEAATRVNYGQNVDKIHMVEGALSLATSGALSIKGGNFQVYEHFLGRSRARVHLNTTVSALTQTPRGAWTLQTADGSTEVYDDVILAAPLHTSGITVAPELLALVPPTPYVRLHVTLLATSSARPAPAYFGLAPGTAAPRTVVTTAERERAGGAPPEFNSLTYHGRAGSTRPDEHVVKIFSATRRSDAWLRDLFGEVGWVHRKEWDAYPVLPPTARFAPVQLAGGLYYVNAFEPFISTMETETLAARNVVDLLFRERFGTGVCGKVTPAPAAVEDAAQVVLPAPRAAPAPDEFVLGWDC